MDRLPLPPPPLLHCYYVHTEWKTYRINRHSFVYKLKIISKLESLYFLAILLLLLLMVVDTRSLIIGRH